MLNRLQPFAKLLLYLICGILAGKYLNVPFIGLVILSVLGLAISFFTHKKYYEYAQSERVFRFQFGMFLVFACIGVLLITVSKNTVLHLDASKEVKGLFQIQNIQVSTSGEQKVFGVLASGVINSTSIVNPVRVSLKLENKIGRQYFPDDVLWLEGTAQNYFQNTNPGGFDYRRYMQNQGYSFRIEPSHVQLYERPEFSLWRMAYEIRITLSKVLERNLQPKELGVAEALVLGQKQFLESETKQAYAGVGAMHILAVSGLHVGLVFLLFNQLLKPLLKVRYGKELHTIFIILIIILYAAITGFSPSVTRASVMFILLSLGMMLRRVDDKYNTIFASAFLMLLYDANLIFNVGFQLSYLAVFGIIYGYQKLFNCIEPKHWITTKIWSLICLAIVAQLATFPLGLCYFHQFPTYFLATNLVVIPAAFAVLFGGFILFASSLFSSFGFTSLELVLGWIYQKIVWLLNQFVEMLFQAPYGTMKDVQINLLQLFLLYSLIILLAIFITRISRVAYRLALVNVVILVGSYIHINYQVQSSSGFLVYQHNKTVFEVFEGKRSVCYCVEPSKNNSVYFYRMIADFNRVSGRNTETIQFSDAFKQKLKHCVVSNAEINSVRLEGCSIELHSEGTESIDTLSVKQAVLIELD